MEYRQFGDTDLEVSVLGFGAGHIGAPEQDDKEVGKLLNHVLDSGINLFDTARGYGLSEERIGRHMASRRKEMILSTKIGYGISGVPDWTRECIAAGIEEALKQLRTDYIDIVHLHSCEMFLLLENESLIEALQKARDDGKVRVIAYSGDNDPAEYVARSGIFGSLETSVNICDQRSIDRVIAPATAAGMGIIAKRPIANAPWRFDEQPVGDYAEEYWNRWKTMNIQPGSLSWQELALRFTLTVPGVCSCIAGTAKSQHLDENIAIAEKGPLSLDMYNAIQHAFYDADTGWVGQV